MDLGSSICKPKNPKCNSCPLLKYCLAHKNNTYKFIPLKTKKLNKVNKKGYLYIGITNEEKIILIKRPKKGLLGGTICPPSSDWIQNEFPTPRPPFKGDWKILNESIFHSFTHFDLELKVMMSTINEYPNDALEMISLTSNGDARWALNTLELISSYHNKSSEITLESALKVISDKPMKYDKKGDSHYDTISAFIKSVRGSDPDAAVYWLARMIEAGEDLNFICRRLIILAAEDIGLADPNAISLAMAAQQACNFVGMPESRIILSQISIYLASAPKSNSAYSAINLAQNEVKNSGPIHVPLDLRNPETKFLREEGYGLNYQYPHNFESGFVKENYLPEEIQSKKFYSPTKIGFESKIMERMKKLWGQINQ